MRYRSLLRRPRPRSVLVTAAAVTLVALPGTAAADPGLPTVASLALAAVNALPPTPNTAWGIDPADDELTLTVSRAAPAVGVARLTAVAERFGDAVRIVHTASPLTEQGLLDPADGDGVLLGGDPMSDSKIICSAGFVVDRGGREFVLTAGHCTAGLPAWQGVGPSVVSEFPGTDYGLIRDDQANVAGDVDMYDGTAQPITTVGAAAVGERVCASGQTTQVSCGQVTAVDETVDYGDGVVVRGLIATNVHTDHGDSGGPLFDGSIGLGVVSGGDGAVDYFQPIAPVLEKYGLELAVP
ncbi:MAG TPA: S1 family peptidase [Pseudonocardiaceae bacterium]|nr:S1 family peptidase [Pseudonocardiaceae bacterium]